MATRDRACIFDSISKIDPLIRTWREGISETIRIPAELTPVVYPETKNVHIDFSYNTNKFMTD